MVSLASEFPNDNPALHRGVIWVCTEPTGGARPERARLPEDAPSESDRELAAENAADKAEVAPDAPLVAIEEATAPEMATASSEPPPRKHDSLAPPEDDVVDDVVAAIVVEELEPIEASLEGAEAELAYEASEADVHVESVVPASVANDVLLCDELADVEDAASARTEEARTEEARTEEALTEEALTEKARTEEERAVVLEDETTSEAEPLSLAPAPAQSEVVLAGTRVDTDEQEPAPAAMLTPVFEEVVASEIPRETSALPPAPDDPFTTLVCTLADVAIGAGSPHVASLLPGLLFDGRLPEPVDAATADALRSAGLWDGNEVAPSFVAVTAAWRAILRGTSDDFDACGAAMLDEWAAELLARLLEAPAKAPVLRQELRSRGIAAFGLAA